MIGFCSPYAYKHSVGQFFLFYQLAQNSRRVRRPADPGGNQLQNSVDKKERREKRGARKMMDFLKGVVQR
jgi:hypothetical protein